MEQEQKQQQQQQLLHFCDSKHPLVFHPDYRGGGTCCGCQESVYGPSYSCKECGGRWLHHKSCAELPLGLHHPLHPIHPLILSPYQIDYGQGIQFSNCILCNESRNQYTYRCFRCDFNFHFTCASLPLIMEQQQLLHFCDSKHPLYFYQDFRGERTCCGCQESVYGPGYCCIDCEDKNYYVHHKSCAELPLGLHHPLHPFHPLILSPYQIDYGKHIQFSNCVLCNESRNQYTYRCFRCDFNLHFTCASLPLIMEQQQLLHFCDSKHPLYFYQDFRGECTCCGCQESVYGPGYCCIECEDKNNYVHHKSCAELSLGLHHPLHPIHPLILSPYQTDYGKHIQFSNCLLCNESRNQYTYRCSRCDFNLHFTCASLPATTMEAEFHDHPLTPILKSCTFTCDLCGKEGKGTPYLCHLCSFWVHGRCASFPCMVKVVRHKHLLHLTHSFLEFHQSDSRFCQICVQKVDTRYGLYYCSRCDFVAHLNCAIDRRNKDINLQEFKDVDEVLELNESADSATYEVKKSNMKEEGTQIVEEIKHISHEHVLKLTNEVPNNKICDGCLRAILPPFYSCVKCRFFLHESCAKLPPKKRHPLHQHPLILLPMKPSEYFKCNAYSQFCNGFTYKCEKCEFYLDVQCSLISDILTHEGHEPPLILSYITQEQKCSCCSNESEQVFRCTTCEFALDYKCATLPHTTRYNQHEHPFTLCYRLEDDSGEYYCDICEEERDSKHWFYYCEDCSYPAHPKCILGEYPNYKFGGVYTFNCHPHPVTLIEKTKNHPPCHKCNRTNEYFIYQCVQCNFNMHEFCALEE